MSTSSGRLPPWSHRREYGVPAYIEGMIRVEFANDTIIRLLMKKGLPFEIAWVIRGPSIIARELYKRRRWAKICGSRARRLRQSSTEISKYTYPPDHPYDGHIGNLWTRLLSLGCSLTKKGEYFVYWKWDDETIVKRKNPSTKPLILESTKKAVDNGVREMKLSLPRLTAWNAFEWAMKFRCSKAGVDFIRSPIPEKELVEYAAILSDIPAMFNINTALVKKMKEYAEDLVGSFYTREEKISVDGPITRSRNTFPNEDANIILSKFRHSSPFSENTIVDGSVRALLKDLSDHVKYIF